MRPTLAVRGALLAIALALPLCHRKDGTAPSAGNAGSGGRPTGASSSVAAAGAPLALAPQGGAAGKGPNTSSVPPEWLTDPTLWRPVPAADFGMPECQIFETTKPPPLPVLTWQSCGSGCSEADAIPPGEGAAFPRMGLVEVDGQPRLVLSTLHFVRTATEFFKLSLLQELENGTFVGGVLGRHSSALKWSPCSFAGGYAQPEFLLLSGSTTKDSPPFQIDAYFDISAGKYAWAAPALPIEKAPPLGMSFSVEIPRGTSLAVGGGGVAIWSDPSSSAWQILEQASASYQGAGYGDLGIWSDINPDLSSRLRGWKGDGQGIRTLVDPIPGPTCDVTLSPASVAGYARPGPGRVCENPANPIQFWVAPRLPDGSIGKPGVLLDIPGTPAGVGRAGVKIWGEYAALLLGPTDASGNSISYEEYFLVIRLADKAMWRIHTRPGHGMHEVAWALTDKYIYFGETTKANFNNQQIDHLVRLDLAQLDVAAERVP